jgi:hypothetical protein
MDDDYVPLPEKLSLEWADVTSANIRNWPMFKEVYRKTRQYDSTRTDEEIAAFVERVIRECWSKLTPKERSAFLGLEAERSEP